MPNLNNLQDLDFNFTIGTVLKLMFSVNKDKAKEGAVGIVVDGKKEFPKLYSELKSHISPEDLENFIGVVWDKDNPNYLGASDGFYLKHRFDINESQIDFRITKNPNVKNNEGRTSCYKCGAATKKVMGFNSQYTICSKCGA